MFFTQKFTIYMSNCIYFSATPLPKACTSNIYSNNNLGILQSRRVHLILLIVYFRQTEITTLYIEDICTIIEINRVFFTE